VGARPTLNAMNNRKITVPAGERNQKPCSRGGSCTECRGVPKGALLGCSPPSLNLNFKNADFVDTILSNVLRDLTLGLNEALKSVDD
jgi:hypothetical protein